MFEFYIIYSILYHIFNFILYVACMSFEVFLNFLFSGQASVDMHAYFYLLVLVKNVALNSTVSSVKLMVYQSNQ